MELLPTAQCSVLRRWMLPSREAMLQWRVCVSTPGYLMPNLFLLSVIVPVVCKIKVAIFASFGLFATLADARASALWI
jgi:hypothetical protein